MVKFRKLVGYFKHQGHYSKRSYIIRKLGKIKMADERFNGTIKYWNSRKGFGFIAPENESEEQKQVFVHIKAFTSREKKPAIGLNVSYIIATDENGRTRAEDVVKADEAVAQKAATKSAIPTVAIALVVISLIVVAVFALK